VRDVVLVERSQFARTPVSFVHVLFPRASSIAADVYWDRVQRRLWLAGQGPYTLEEHPILERVLGTLVAADGFALPLATLFETVWAMPYNPLVHENKAHVAIHRLRSWLESHRKGMGRAVLVRDGIVSIAEDIEVVVLEPGHVEAEVERPPLRDRILAALTEQSPVSARELEERLEISRTALNNGTRELLASGEIIRTGQGRALHYSRVNEDDR
jgi:biotin operon repressor